MFIIAKFLFLCYNISMNRRNMKKILLWAGIFILIMACMYKCPYDYILGISCPGCGMTRAFLSLLCLDFSSAFYYHPLFPLVILTALYLIAEYLGIFRLKQSHKNICCRIICALFILVYFIRLFSGSEIVSIDIKDSILAKIIKYLSQL